MRFFLLELYEKDCIGGGGVVFHVGQFDDGVFSSESEDPAIGYDRYMREMLAFQTMEDILSPRELNMARCRLGLGQPNGQRMTFQMLAIQLNYNDPSGAEKVYNRAVNKQKKNPSSSVYGKWRALQQSIRNAKAEVECKANYCITPQRTWYDKFSSSK